MRVRAVVDALRLGEGTAVRLCAVLICAAMVCLPGLVISMVTHVPTQNGLLIAGGALFAILVSGSFLVLGPTDEALEAALPRYAEALVEARRGRARRRAMVQQAKAARAEALAETRANAEQVAATTCPYCKERIHPEAIKCKHCGEVFDTDSRADRDGRVRPRNNPKASTAPKQTAATAVGCLIFVTITIICAGALSSGGRRANSPEQTARDRPLTDMERVKRMEEERRKEAEALWRGIQIEEANEWDKRKGRR